MNKKSAIISRIKNRILSIISKLQNRNTEPDVTEEKEQPVDSEPISRSENETETRLNENKELLIDHEEKSSEKKEEVLTRISEVLRKWLEFDEKMEKFDEMVEKGRKEILKDRKDISNKIIEGISGLEDEYDKRLKDLKTSIEELKKKKEEKPVFDFITSEEELEKDRDVVETAKSNPITENGTFGYTDQVTADTIKRINEMGLMGSFDDTDLKKLWLIMSTMSLLPEKDKEITGLDENTIRSMDPSHPQFEYYSLKKRMDEINIQLLYDKGVKLLKKGDFEGAYECFDKITNKNPDLKGAWLNRGFAVGELGDIEEEIRSYEKALSKDKKYGKAQHNMKIAERKKRKI